MSYSQAIEKAWKDITELTAEEHLSVRFLSDAYDIDIVSRRVLSGSCNVCAKDYITIILLHYLFRKLAAGKISKITGEWIDFNDLEGGEGYYPAFKKRTIDHLISKYGEQPEALVSAASRMNGKSTGLGDVSVIIHPFDEVAILVKMSKADEEFPPDASILFDKNITGIFCTEDVVVMTELIVHQL